MSLNKDVPLYSVTLGPEAQVQYCKENDTPLFAPSDGKCWQCRRDIYTKISVQEAASKLITSCPHCNRSFID